MEVPYKLTDIVLKASLDELKLRAIDRRNMQDAKIRQLIYLCFTLSAAICTVIMMTPFWSGKAALLHSATTWHLLFLCLALVLCVGGFIYGTWALMGENGGNVPIIREYAEFLRNGFGSDDSGKPYKAVIDWLDQTDLALMEYEKMISAKGLKIRTLNKIVLCAAVCAALSSAALFTSKELRKI